MAESHALRINMTMLYRLEAEILDSEKRLGSAEIHLWQNEELSESKSGAEDNVNHM